MGLEPTTPTLPAWCSSQLSYSPEKEHEPYQHRRRSRTDRRLLADLGHVRPQPLQLVVVAGLLQEDVDDEVAVIEQHPAQVVETLDPQRPRSTCFGDLPLDLLGDGAH